MAASNDNDKKQAGLLDWLSWAFGSIGDIFSLIFWGALILGGAYFLLGHTAVGDWVKDNFPGFAAWIDEKTGGRLFGGAAAEYLNHMSIGDARDTLKDELPEATLNILLKTRRRGTASRHW
ncbi:MAG: hypothetical protein WDN72_08530 [Alphaproteobacteria bacterium]